MTRNQTSVTTIAELSFLGLIFSLAFMQPVVRLAGISVTLTDLTFLLTVAIMLVAVIVGQMRLRFDRLFILIGLYALGLLLAATFSVNPTFSFVKLAGEFYLLALVVLSYNLVRKKTMLSRVVAVWLAASVVTALAGTISVAFFYLGISNFLTDFAVHHYGSLTPGNYPRIQSTFLYPSMLCNYLTVGSMMLLAAWRIDLLGLRGFIVLAAIFSIAIAFTVTPGIGGLLLVVGFWLYLVFAESGRPGLSKLVLGGGIMAALAFLIVSAFTLNPTPTSPFFFSLGGVRIDPTQRLLTWLGALQTFLEYPFFGKGLGLGVANVSFMPPSGKMQMLTDAHSVLLNVSGQAGISGAIPLILICIAVVKRITPFRFTSDNILLLSLGLAFISAFIVQGVVGSFENARHLWVLIGLILAAGHSNEPSQLSDAENNEN